MSKTWRLLLLLITSAVPMICTAANSYQSATVVAVEKRVPATTYFRDSPSEAPLAANRVSYDISVQAQCTIYVGRYRSEINYLPTEFVANHSVNIRLQKNVMYVSVPGSDDVKMGIVRRRRVTGGSCGR